MRTALRAAAVVVALMAVGWVALLITGQLFRSDDHVTSSFTGVSRLLVATGFEAVEIIGSDAATGLAVERDWSWSMRAPRTATTRSGDTLTITSNCPYTPGPECRGTVRIVVPTGIAVDASTGDGHLRLDNLSGPITLGTGDGSITADRLHGPDIAAVTGDGDVRLAFSEPPTSVKVTSGDGDIHVELPNARDVYRVDAEAADGAETVTVPTDPAANRHIDVTTQDGTVQVTGR